ncbi:MAG: cytochrome oxidase [Gemmatimonadetes bacterium]|uniref:Cytochrome oxidase n=1 Tax=Candidatus Kutchimonas denitrificans TaxID=3056748 RepID=A0AAE4Z4I8_9BACT|nr:cytochrome oxidase [Gemmatimonadota bacterium]NIR73629.1 cytochrome oxidase [Candidatus Kutchimonas denitrificans]NIR99588.1 cytochrome oxidase [Gemmatimonadota bacterium]NIT65208.1 cytochrome oxidase [Gemmatimonadota bacterium]NIV23741.1 cytochrome oxidase [Gemmatimonadota bacterium]
MAERVATANVAGAESGAPPSLDDLVDRRLVRTWLYWGLFWLMFFPTVGVIVSTKFNFPDFLGGTSWLTFGRLRPLHVNGVIFGSFSTLFFGLCYYLVPRLAGIRVVWERLGHWLAWLWNVTIAAGVISLALGTNQGLEAAEFAWYVDLGIFVVLAGVTLQFLLTIARRKQQQVYTSIWYLLAALVWTDINWVLGAGVLPFGSITGINNAALHGLFIHYVVGLWITPAGYVLIYYFLPLSVRNPIYSHKLSLIGFWSLAFFYPFVGIHHYLFSPIADWAETIAIITSMLLIIPVWTVLQNFFGTMIGRWSEFGRNLPAKFLIMGSIMYLIGCLQGSTEALRSLQRPTHFTDFVISHSHLTVFGTFVVWALAGVIYVWPKIHDRPLWSFKLGNWSFWLITAGISGMGLILTGGGLAQGLSWMQGAEWLDSMRTIKPFWYARTFTGITMDLGMTLLVYNLMKTFLARPHPRATEPAPALAGD